MPLFIAISPPPLPKTWLSDSNTLAGSTLAGISLPYHRVHHCACAPSLASTKVVQSTSTNPFQQSQCYQFAFVPPSPEFNTRPLPQNQTPKTNERSLFHLRPSLSLECPARPQVTTTTQHQVPDDVHVEPPVRSGYGDGDANAVERNDSPFPDVDRDCSPTLRSATATPNSSNADSRFRGW